MFSSLKSFIVPIATRLANQTLKEAHLRQASTRSIIGVELRGGQIKYIYCHFDSQNNLSYLRQFYTDPQDIKELIDGGSIRSLTENIEDLPRMGEPAETDTLDQIKDTNWTDYYFLYRNGRWSEVTAGVPSRQTRPDMRQVHIVEAEDALRRALNAGLNKPEFEQVLTMQEGNHNKYHLFAIYNVDGEYVGGNAYGGIGTNPRTIEVARGSKSSVYSALQSKIRAKQNKGYKGQ